METNCQTFNVMPGEPQLGKVTECERTYDRDDIIEVIKDYILDDMIDSVTQTIPLDPENELYPKADEFIGQNDLDNILETMERELLDDDYGSPKESDLIYSMLDQIIPDDMEYTVSWEEYN